MTPLMLHQVQISEQVCDDFKMQNSGAEFFAWQMSRYFDFRQMKDFDVSWVV